MRPAPAARTSSERSVPMSIPGWKSPITGSKPKPLVTTPSAGHTSESPRPPSVIADAGSANVEAAAATAANRNTLPIPAHQRTSEDLGAPGQRAPREHRVRPFDRSLRDFFETQGGAQLRERDRTEICRTQSRDVERDVGVSVHAGGAVRRHAPPPLVPRADGVADVEHERAGAGV